MNRDFKEGDMAVYPAHGVGEVKGIETREISGEKHKFYILKILDNGMTIMVPKGNVKSVGLREIINGDEVEEVFEILKERDVTVDTQTWNRRYREYMDKIKTGSVYEIAEVLRDLSLLKFEKELSFGERKMLDMARNLLVRELAVATGQEEAEIFQEIQKIFKS
ncbi:MAG: CarD family transcriptional regulator [Deltaproteobacteria bacterium RIFCSPLOWO2_02_FULL_50_16]|nr:MAG: CarD family transcriptional regulator [Deltaproteobacteria bacterium GWA2_50_8]OGQ30509.1 MAG: CarD family transcriptional regulator [Deltaproteobacteria bacterium RIFCSPHIGHO2_02_FULL_50_15]OGQ56369.1 MAG: CarD family transcriptional regulator [Deltaproteobacteria bacterium RIFCSPLOWO2_02_FULL_50_16]OGQ67772.1 MAG: CarD family transcriptional regulator [Deltaproteobacteria bacterium RIFCSPLOWO2_12_FULL_50_11]